MSWQEELRKLDEELASGRLSADDYRVRRDQVLSSAVSQEEGAGATAQDQQPQQPGTAGTSGPTADSTQVISPLTPGTSSTAEATQAIPQWQAQPPAQPPYQQGGFTAPPNLQQPSASPAGGFPQPPPAGGFQSVQGSPPTGFPQPQQPWNAPEQDQSPPWVGGEFPPIAASGSSEWAAQGPEGFDNKSGSGGKGKIFAIIGAVVLLAGVAVGAYLLWGRGDTTASSGTSDDKVATQEPSMPASTSQAPPDPLPMGDIPGNPENHSAVKTFADIPGLNYLNEKELKAYENTDPGDVKFAVYHLDNGNLAIVLLTQVGDKTKAGEEVSNLASIQIANGAKEVTKDTPDGVLVTGFDPEDGRSQFRAHYLSDDVLVRIELNSEKDLDSARTDFDRVLDTQLQVLSADE